MADPARSLTLSLLCERYAIVRLASDAAIPAWASRGEFFSITSTPDELSIVCASENVPANDRPPLNWGAFKVHGPFQFDEIGVLSSLAAPLAAARIGIFVVSTFDTDYLFVQSKDICHAVATLQSAGHTILDRDSILQKPKENKE